MVFDLELWFETEGIEKVSISLSLGHAWLCQKTM